MHLTKSAPVVAAVTLGAALAGCGPERTMETYNADDITFMQGMIPHHEQAIEMARLVAERTDRPELHELAASIIASQQAEIEEMRGMLAEAGVEPEPPVSMDMDVHGLAGLRGMDFDLRFAETMIAHHQGAIASAEEVLARGQHPEVADLARDVIAEQEAEIAQMRRWLEEWRAEAS